MKNKVLKILRTLVNFLKNVLNLVKRFLFLPVKIKELKKGKSSKSSKSRKKEAGLENYTYTQTPDSMRDYATVTEESTVLYHKRIKIISASLGFLILTFVIFSYLISSIQERAQYSEFVEDAPLLKIVVPHPNEISDAGNYRTVEHKVKGGENIATILASMNVDNQQIYDILQALKKHYNIRSMQVGEKLYIRYFEQIKNTDKGIKRKIIVDEFRVLVSLEETVIVTRKDDNTYDSEKKKRVLTKYIMKYKGVINNSLFVDALADGVPANVIAEMISLYSFDVDFQREIQKGTEYEVVFEEYYTEDGQKIKNGDIMYLALRMRNRDVEMYNFKRDNGTYMYFTAEGKGARKSLMRTPINGARISSRYGYRKHPILGYSKLHKGTDFAAPRGTPFFAAGDGVITIRRRWSTWGNYIRIRHNKDYSTEYAHANSFRRGFKVGSRVKQGDVIAYVGNTGRSTGPHLHYGVIYKGKRINPGKVKTVSSIKLRGKELKRFKSMVDRVNSYRRNTPNQNKTI